MQTLHISRQELHTRGGVLDRMLDSLFDTAILVDTDCRILYISASSFPDPSQRQRWWGSISQCWTSSPLPRRCCAPANPGPISFWSSMAGPVSPACFPSWTGSGSSAWWAPSRCATWAG